MRKDCGVAAVVGLTGLRALRGVANAVVGRPQPASNVMG